MVCTSRLGNLSVQVGGGADDSSYIAASTAQIGPDFTIFNIDTVVESEGPRESDPELTFKLKIENLETL
jgi:hypothetical protein